MLKDKIDEETTIREFKEIMIEMFRGYPRYVFFGLFEEKFGKAEGQRIVNILTKDKLIETDYNIKEDLYWYRLSEKGINFAISMVNLEHSEKTLKYSKEMHWFTIAIVFLTLVQIALVIL